MSDWAAARQGCGAGGQRSNVISQKGTKEGYKDILADEFNVAWEVIKRNGFLNANKDLANLCMTLAGTIVSYREGDKGRVVTYPSKADNDDLLKALFDGGEATLYACSDSTGKCLRMKDFIEVQAEEMLHFQYKQISLFLPNFTYFLMQHFFCLHFYKILHS